MRGVSYFLTHAISQIALAAGLVLATASLVLGQSEKAQVPPKDAQPSSGTTARALSPAERQDAVRTFIELWESRVRKKLQSVDQILSGLDLRQIQAQKIAVDQLLEILDDLDEEALAITDAYAQVGPDLRLYRQALHHAPGVFQAIADDLEKQAVENTSPFLKEAYADFAGAARNLATTYEAKERGIGDLETAIATKMEFVYESRRFITAVRGFLKAIPAEHGLETERLIARINQYIDVFQEAIKALKGVADKIGTEPRPIPGTEAKKPTSATQADKPPSPISIEE